MRYLILFLLAVFLSSCSYQLTLMPRDSGTIYHGIATGDGITKRGNLSITIDETTYSGTWMAMKNPSSVTVINNPQPEYSSTAASAMASSSAAASAAMASASGGSNGRALLSSPEGRGLRCEFQYGSFGIGDGVCIDDNGRVYDLQISMGR